MARANVKKPRFENRNTTDCDASCAGYSCSCADPRVTGRIKRTSMLIPSKIFPISLTAAGHLTGNMINTVICCVALTSGLRNPPPGLLVQPNRRSRQRKIRMNRMAPPPRSPANKKDDETSSGHRSHKVLLPERNHPSAQVAQSTPLDPSAQRWSELLPPKQASGTGQS